MAELCLFHAQGHFVPAAVLPFCLATDADHAPGTTPDVLDSSATRLLPRDAAKNRLWQVTRGNTARARRRLFQHSAGRLCTAQFSATSFPLSVWRGRCGPSGLKWHTLALLETEGAGQLACWGVAARLPVCGCRSASRAWATAVTARCKLTRQLYGGSGGPCRSTGAPSQHTGLTDFRSCPTAGASAVLIGQSAPQLLRTAIGHGSETRMGGRGALSSKGFYFRFFDFSVASAL